MAVKRFVRLRPVEPDLMVVESVLCADSPPLDPLVVAAPSGKTDDELLRLAKAGSHWVEAESVENGSTSRRGPIEKSEITKGELLWNGFLYNLSGYAKANREMLFRCQKKLKIQLITGDYLPEKMNHPEDNINNRLAMAEQVQVSPKAPLLRFFLPRRELDPRYRILWFMTETEKMHPRLVTRIDSFYDEVWFPTQWNIDSFLISGGQKPTFKMPLGVDPEIYKPGYKGMMPICERLAPFEGQGVPRGFVFLYVFQPVFRKGAEFLVRSFEKAFSTRKDVNLVLATTGYPTEPWMGSIKKACGSSNIWMMNQKMSESRMADLYSAADAYVCTSMGEGFNMPIIEAAASGLPVIAPNHTAHTDYLTRENSYLFEPDGFDKVEGAKSFCSWYDEQNFAKFGDRAQADLVAHLWSVFFNYEEAKAKAAVLRKRILRDYTWDQAADRMVSRLRDLSSCPL